VHLCEQQITIITIKKIIIKETAAQRTIKKKGKLGKLCGKPAVNAPQQQR